MLEGVNTKSVLNCIGASSGLPVYGRQTRKHHALAAVQCGTITHCTWEYTRSTWARVYIVNLYICQKHLGILIHLKHYWMYDYCINSVICCACILRIE